MRSFKLAPGNAKLARVFAVSGEEYEQDFSKNGMTMATSKRIFWHTLLTAGVIEPDGEPSVSATGPE